MADTAGKLTDGNPIEALERFVVENDDLLALEERIGRFNIFDALGVARAEIRHSNFLAWLLDPGETHGQGDLFLKAVLMDLLRRTPPSHRPLSPVELDGVELRGIEVRREWRNIDLLVICREPGFIVAVENKVDSGEHSGQLGRYAETVRDDFTGSRSLLVLLTPEGDEASDKSWTSYSYADLHRVLSRVRRTNHESIGAEVLTFLDHYLGLIGSRFMDDPQIDELCRRIYRDHRPAIDMIVERKQDEVDVVIRSLRDWIGLQTSTMVITGGLRRYLEFAPVSWMSAVPAIGKQADGKRWLHFWIGPFGGKLRFEIAAEASEREPLRRRIVERLTRDQKEFGLRLRVQWKDGSRNCLATTNVAPLNADIPSERLFDRAQRAITEALDRLKSVPDAVSEAVQDGPT